VREGTAQLRRSVAYIIHTAVTYFNTVYIQVKTRRAAGHGGRRATADYSTAGHGEARRTGGHVYYCVLWNAGGYVRCRASTIPYDYWCMGMEDRRRRRGEEGISTITPRGGFRYGYSACALGNKGLGPSYNPNARSLRSLRSRISELVHINTPVCWSEGHINKYYLCSIDPYGTAAL
jgi:hypothetical protein